MFLKVHTVSDLDRVTLIEVCQHLRPAPGAASRIASQIFTRSPFFFLPKMIKWNWKELILDWNFCRPFAIQNPGHRWQPPGVVRILASGDGP